MRDNIRRILQFYRLLKPQRLVAVFAGGLLASVPVIVSLLVPLMVKRIIDTLEQLKRIDYRGITHLALLFAASTLLSYLGEIVYNRHKALAAEEMRDTLFRHALHLPLKKVHQFGSAYFTKLIADQVNSAFEVLDYAYMRNYLYLIRMVIVLGIVYTWDRLVFWIFITNAILVLFYSSIMSKATQPHWKRLMERVRQINAFVGESFDNLHELMAGEAVKKRGDQHQGFLSEITNDSLKAETTRVGLDRLLIDIPAQISQILIILLCARNVVMGDMTVGTFMAIWTYYGYATAPIYVFRDLSRAAVQSGTTLERILQMYAEVVCPNGHVNHGSTHVEPLLSASHLGVELSGASILHDVDFGVTAGELVSVVGLSGEGKSTLLSILLGLERDYQGSIQFRGQEIRDLPSDYLFSHVGYYSQNVGVFNDTLEKNIVLGRGLDQQRLDQIIHELDLGHLRGRALGAAGNFISGGEKQRVQLARLIYADKEFVVVDEPLTNLDAISEQKLMELLARHLQGKSGVIISHKPNVMRLATSMILIDKGTIACSGTEAQLMQDSALYRDLIAAHLSGAARRESQSTAV